MRKALAFLKRDLQELLSYKLAFLGELAGIFLPLFTFFFVAKLLEGRAVASLAPYGGDYFPFVLIGIALSSYLVVVMQALSGSISRAQATGTMEALLCTQTEIPAILAATSLFPFLQGAVHVLLLMGAGVLFFGAGFSNPNIPGALLVFFLTVLCFAAIGVISAGFIMVFKKGDPVTWILGAVSGLLGGVMYPVSILPGWMQALARWIPLKHSLEGIRRALLAGAPTGELLAEMRFFLVLTVLLLPASLAFFSAAVRKAKRDGTLTQF